VKRKAGTDDPRREAITEQEAIELGAFLAEHDLPLLENVPFVQRMLYDDMQRSKAGQRPQCILFSPPERIESVRKSALEPSP